jgi:hypothetical protein
MFVNDCSGSRIIRGEQGEGAVELRSTTGSETQVPQGQPRQPSLNEFSAEIRFGESHC